MLLLLEKSIMQINSIICHQSVDQESRIERHWNLWILRNLIRSRLISRWGFLSRFTSSPFSFPFSFCFTPKLLSNWIRVASLAQTSSWKQRRSLSLCVCDLAATATTTDDTTGKSNRELKEKERKRATREASPRHSQLPSLRKFCHSLAEFAKS